MQAVMVNNTSYILLTYYNCINVVCYYQLLDALPYQ
jgi:hypothetical protein